MILRKFLFLKDFEPHDSYKKNSYKTSKSWSPEKILYLGGKKKMLKKKFFEKKKKSKIFLR